MIANTKKLVPAIIYPSSDNHISVCTFDYNVLVRVGCSKKPQYKSYLSNDSANMVEWYSSDSSAETAISTVTGTKYLTVAHFGQKYVPINYFSSIVCRKGSGSTKYTNGIDYKPKYVRLSLITTKNVFIEEKTIYKTSIQLSTNQSYDENGNVYEILED